MVDIPITSQIRGRQSIGNVFEESARKQLSEANRLYDSANAITVTTGTTDADITGEAGGSGLFVNVPTGAIAEIFSNQNVSVKFRTPANAAVAVASLPPINIRANTLRTLTQIADFSAIFITNSSGSTATVEVLLT